MVHLSNTSLEKAIIQLYHGEETKLQIDKIETMMLDTLH
jgi:hypothetical protein